MNFIIENVRIYITCIIYTIYYTVKRLNVSWSEFHYIIKNGTSKAISVDGDCSFSSQPPSFE